MMKTTITRIGNSKGIIIPASMMRLCGFDKEVSIEVKDQSLVITQVKEPREDWEAAFVKAGAGEDPSLMDGLENSFDKEEWTW